MNLNALTVPQKISAAAILVVAVAAFLPWVSFLGFSALGIEGDGVITLGLAIAGTVVMVMTTGVVGREPSSGTASHIALVVLAVVTALIGLVDMNGAATIGLYLTLLAGVAWSVGAVWQLTLVRSQPAASGETSCRRRPPHARSSERKPERTSR